MTESGSGGTPFGAENFVAELCSAGFDFFSGVPCSLIKETIACLGKVAQLPAAVSIPSPPGAGEPAPRYIDATREDAAVGLSVGAALAGKRPCILMQNSGLGTSLNSLTSLAVLYRVPMLLVVTWRGEGGRDAPEHLIMGKICGKVMEAARVPYRIPSAGAVREDLAWAAKTMAGESRPVALLLSKGVVE